MTTCPHDRQLIKQLSIRVYTELAPCEHVVGCDIAYCSEARP